MWKVLFRARNRFARDQRGNVAILFAFSAIPLVGLLGGAADVTRHHRYKAELLNAMDATTIALVRSNPASDADADEFVNRYIAPMLPGGDNDPTLHMKAFDAIEVEGGYRVVSDGYMDTAFMQVVGISEMLLDLETEVRMSGGKYEVALALDNTGSMRNFGRIEALRDAAEQLVDDLYKEEGTEDRVKMALVPFVTAVNVGYSDGFDRANFIDPVGADPVFQMNFSDPSGGSVNRLSLFTSMKTQWAGCVEARIEDDEDGDTLPDGQASKWVPYLWPDEPDSGFTNSYLNDSGTGDVYDQLRHTTKYTVKRAPTNTSNLGPNAACPGKVIPLTNDADLMRQEIRKMKPHNQFGSNNSGTNVAQGLVWGWRALSPTTPFVGHEGVEYGDEETTKVLVLLSDGRNQVVSGGNRETRETQSDYTSFGYLADGRLGYTEAEDFERAEETVDEKVSRVCEAAKEAGIRVYTILFQVDFEKTQDLFRNCASVDEDTNKPLYHYVPDASALETAFQDIGKDLSTLRIAH